MSHAFVAFLISVFVAIVAFIYVAKTKNRTTSNTSSSTNYGKYVAGIATGLALLSLIVAVFTIVPTKRVGVVTSFGKPTGTLSNGLHAIWPWEKVTSFDAAIQTDRHDDERKDGDTGNNPDKCTLVRIANGGSTACLDNIIRWRIRKDEADALYRDYRDFDRVRESLVTRELVASLNKEFLSFDPLASLDVNKQSQAGIAERAVDVKADLEREIGDQIEILSVNVPLPHYSRATEDKLNQYQTALAQTRIATQNKDTATQEAEANNNLANSVKRSPNVLVSKCLDALNDMIKARIQPPAGFSCWPGSQSAVVIPSSKK